MTDPAKPGDNPPAQRNTEFKRGRQLTKHSQADVATALGVSRQTVSRWENGERVAPQDVIEWLQINHNQYFSDIRSLCSKVGPEGKPGKRGEDLRPARAKVLEPLTSLMAKAAEKA